MKLLLYYYSIFFSFFITLGTAYMGFQSGQPIFFLLFLPVTLYFSLTILKFKKGRKFLLYYNFILTTIMAIMGFVEISSVPQLVSAVLFLPMALYFWLLVLPKRNKKLPIPDKLSVIPAINPEERKNLKGKMKILEGEVVPEKKFGKNFDLDRRMFLKLIGSTGILVFMFSIFSKKAEGAFFGSVPGSGTVALKDTSGAKIDPAQLQPTDGYKIAELDDGTPAYYGFTRKDGAWFIMKEQSGASRTYLYTRNSSDFDHATTGWPNRASLTYSKFEDIF
ncbi:MAG: hypothetical protein CO028_04885 [Candidatus Levybacteria bacterium CG_4_9_14_0_2_um_filter_35_21]|nr:MAG: hypothetical protein COW87_00245 [Candidatus Levybacteria bacterium CG22_combo_CG10-13_8_21_14_all_35_11]PJC53975.1 MAG: hypothetical protein CO028_04885 [Candidatus Levybacteria bacterium CG_4_9_14_0_2_um_filter_35_21]